MRLSKMNGMRRFINSMKIKKGYTWKSIEGPAKGKEFTVVDINVTTVFYRSEETGIIYEKPRKEFEKYIQRVNKHWSDTNKSYKRNKQKLREQ